MHMSSPHKFDFHGYDDFDDDDDFVRIPFDLGCDQVQQLRQLHMPLNAATMCFRHVKDGALISMALSLIGQ
eukprot:1120069-Karenia_brevis.AAC.1